MYDRVSKGVKDKTVNQMVEDATRALEVVVDELWVPWAAHLVPNVAYRVRAEAEARVWEEHDCRNQEEVEHIVQEKMTRAAGWDKRVGKKLTELLADQIMQEAFQEDSEAEEIMEVEESEAVGMEDFETTGGTQASAIEVEEEVEDEVVVVEEVKPGEMRKWEPLLLPKTSRKRVHAAMGTQPSVESQVQPRLVEGSQVGSGNTGSMGRLCGRCVKYQTQCVVVSGAGQCKNC